MRMLHLRAASLWALIVAFSACGASAARGPAADPLAAGGRQALPGVVLVKLRAPLPEGTAGGTGIRPLDAALAGYALLDLAPVAPAARAPRKPGDTDLKRVYRVRYADGAPPQAVAARLARLAGVEYAEPQWVYPLDVTPNDPSYAFSQSGYLARMRFPQAWDRTKGAQGNAVVAIVDGGTDWRHVDLQANVWSNPGEIAGNSLDDDGNGFVDDVHGWNFANGTGDPTGLPGLDFNAIHGTHTAGIACAVTNNAQGIAGASWNAKLMPICASSPTQDNSIAFGFDGILYAADNGADVVSCSWGSLGSASVFEQDVVDYAWEHGVAVVAAAGNNDSSQRHYPSAYAHVLSVANVDSFDLRVLSSNYGVTVDVAAQGLNIFSTTPGNTYSLLTGTSMSCPHVAAICALVKTRWPAYSPDQVMERVRVTSDNIDGVNPARAGLLGYGRVNARAALTKNTPALRITQLQVHDTDGDGIIEPGETVQLDVGVTNFLAPCTGLTFALRETSSYASVIDSVTTLASIDSMQSLTLPPLRLSVAAGAPIDHAIGCILQIGTGAPAYTDRDRFTLTVLPTFVTHDANHVVTSVTSVGKLGFSMAAGGTGADGVGFEYKGSPNLLFEGALLLGTGPGAISDAARGLNPLVADDDFATLPGGVPRLMQPGPWAPQQSSAAFNDSLAASPLSVRVRQDTYEYVDAVHDDYVILRYTIRNHGGNTLDGLHVGWFCDWDIDGSSYATNRSGFDTGRGLGYAYDGSGGVRSYIGTRVLNAAGATSCRGIVNDPTIAPDWGVYDNFTDQEKWDCLAGGIQHPAVGPEDISTAIATGPFSLAPGDSVEVGFAFVGGDDLADLQANADAAALKWQHLHSGTPVEVYDLAAEPDGGEVVVRWRTAHEQDVLAFRIYRGRDHSLLLALQPDVATRADRTYTFRDPVQEPGTYIYRIGEVASDGSVLLHGSAAVTLGATVPRRAFLDPARPNPFNPTTTLRFGVASAGPVALDLFDARGRLVLALVRAEGMPPGVHQVVWDGRDDAGARVASGIYVARLRTSGSMLSRRLTLLQ